MATNTDAGADARFDPLPTTDSIVDHVAPFPTFSGGDFHAQLGVRYATRTSIEAAIAQEAGR